MNAEIKDLGGDRDQIVDKYDEQIKELNRRISEMSSDFAQMLKE